MITRQEILSRYEDELFGIPVVIRNAVIRETDERGDSFITIPDEAGLAAAIAMTRALVPVKLSGDDIRMMRKTLGLKAKDFAAALDMAPARLSRLERDTRGLGSFTELNIRQFVCAHLKRLAPAISYDPAEIATMRPVDGEVGPLEFERVRLKLAESQRKSDEWDRAA
jgi:transcriptional regulator with XRE-family HTH domain